MSKPLSTIPVNEWPIESWRQLVEKIDRMRDELDTARAKLDDESHEPHGMHKINIAHALYVVVKKLRDLTFWAHVPDPEPLPAGWLDAVKDGLQPAITRRNFLADNRVTGYASVTRQKIFSAGFP